MFQNKQKCFLALLTLLAVALGGTLGSGCAVRRGDRSTVRPLALDKKQFDGEWYYATTIVGAPSDAPAIFEGITGGDSKIRFEVTERYLYAFTTRPTILNAESTVSPVAAWPIESHFTVRYQINYSTGEPSNVISEDMVDKPWYERPHFRVIWGRSAISDYSNSLFFYQLFGYVQKEFMGSNLRPEDVRFEKDYFDFISEELISPGIPIINEKYGQDFPISDYRIKIRHAFRKVMPSTYTSKKMQDDQFEKFGFFRTSVVVRNHERGFTDWSFNYFANRHNVATKEEIDAGSKKPKQIVYYLSANFPDTMKDAAQLIADDWNKAFQRALQRPGEKIFILKSNEDGLPKGQTRLMGDIRYNFLYWVDKPLLTGLLGYGPSITDYDTGEIISGQAYYYGETVKRYADYLLLLYNMIKGVYTDEDLKNGKDYLDTVSSFFYGTTQEQSKSGLTADEQKKIQELTSYKGIQIKQAAFQGFDLQKAHQYVQSDMFKLKTKQIANLDRSQISSRFALIDKHPSVKWSLISDDILKSYFPNVQVRELQDLTSQGDAAQTVLDSYLNPANLVRPSVLAKLKQEQKLLEKNNVFMGNYIDPALSKFVQANKDKSETEIRLMFEKMIFRATEAHEIGHTLGLRHNFEGSADELNYFDEYNELKPKQGGNTPHDDKDARHAWFYMYSSIMDYHGELYGDAVGVGKYDHAALMYAYGGLLELDKDFNVNSGGINYKSEFDAYLKKVEDEANKGVPNFWKDIYTKMEVKRGDMKTFQGFSGETLFKTNQVLLEVKGIKADGSSDVVLTLDTDNLTGYLGVQEAYRLFNVSPSRAFVTDDGQIFHEKRAIPLKRRPYKFCSDELVGQNPLCLPGDSGSNPKMIVENLIRKYDGFYPLRNWARGSRYFRLTNGYLYRLVNQFSIISNFYQNWMFRLINENDFSGSQEYFDQLAAVSKGIQFINRIIHTPEPGRHVLDKTSNTWIPSTDDSADVLSIPVGLGRYFYSTLQQDELGYATYRFTRIGTMWDKYIALMALGIRDWGLSQNRLNFFYVNFSDYFSEDDVTDIFVGAISGIFNERYTMSYDNKPIQPNYHPILQYASMYMGLTMLNSALFGNTFGHYLTVGVKGDGLSWEPPAGAKTISFSNAANTRTYFAVQTTDSKSISWKLVSKGQVLSKKLSELRAGGSGSATNQGEIDRVESELRWVETVLQQMREMVMIFYDPS